MTNVYVTIDTELSSRHFWRHGANGLRDNFLRSIEGRTHDGRQRVGVGYQMERMEAHGLRGVFFVDPMPALVAGDGIIDAIVDPILTRGHDVQLHVHTEWLDFVSSGPADGRRGHNMAAFSLEDQKRILDYALGVFDRVSVPRPIAFRAGNYGANDDTLRALAQVGLQFDTSFCPGVPDAACAIDLPVECRDPVERLGIVEVPIAAIGGWGNKLRHAQVTALSRAEVRSALDHAVKSATPSFTMVSHSFELMCRARKRANPIVMKRFDDLCAYVAEQPQLASATYADCPPVPVVSPAAVQDRLPHSFARTIGRMSEQLLSNELYGVPHQRRAKAAAITDVGAVRQIRDRIVVPFQQATPLQQLAIDILTML